MDEGALIGAESRVWHWVHICGEAEIGKGVSLGQNVFVGNKVSIGDKSKIQNNFSVYDNAILEEGAFCGPSMIFTIAYYPRSLIERKKKYSSTLVKKGATLSGANCAIECDVTIGGFAFVGADAVINKDAKPYVLMFRGPAKQIGWMSEYGEKLEFSPQGYATAICPHTGQKYYLKDDVLSKFKLARTPSYLKIDYDDIEDSQIIASVHAVNVKVITQDNEMLEKCPATATSSHDYLRLPADESIDFVSLKKQYFDLHPQIETQKDEVLNTSSFIMGDKLRVIEERLQEFTGAKHAITFLGIARPEASLYRTINYSNWF